jgi:hypothetical protein
MGNMDLMRPLGVAGIRCVVVTLPHSMPEHSRFTSMMISWPGKEIADGADELLDCLVRFGMRQAEQPMLLYEQDTQLLFASHNRETLAKTVRFVIPDPVLQIRWLGTIRCRSYMHCGAQYQAGWPPICHQCHCTGVQAAPMHREDALLKSCRPPTRRVPSAEGEITSGSLGLGYAILCPAGR